MQQKIDKKISCYCPLKDFAAASNTAGTTLDSSAVYGTANASSISRPTVYRLISADLLHCTSYVLYYMRRVRVIIDISRRPFNVTQYLMFKHVFLAENLKGLSHQFEFGRK